MPTDGTQISFNTWHKETRPPFVIYADLEAFDVRTDKFKEMQTKYDSGLNSKSAETMIIEHQYPCSFGMVLVDVRSSSIAKCHFIGAKTSLVSFWTFWGSGLSGQQMSVENIASWKWNELKNKTILQAGQTRRLMYLSCGNFGRRSCGTPLPSYGQNLWCSSFSMQFEGDCWVICPNFLPQLVTLRLSSHNQKFWGFGC